MSDIARRTTWLFPQSVVANVVELAIYDLKKDASGEEGTTGAGVGAVDRLSTAWTESAALRVTVLDHTVRFLARIAAFVPALKYELLERFNGAKHARPAFLRNLLKGSQLELYRMSVEVLLNTEVRGPPDKHVYCTPCGGGTGAGDGPTVRTL